MAMCLPAPQRSHPFADSLHAVWMSLPASSHDTLGRMTARAASLRGHTRGAASAGTVQRLVCREPRAFAGAVRSRCRGGVLQPAHRPPPSDRLLRRPPAGFQLQHTGQARAGRPRHRRRASKRLFARGIDPSEDRGRTKRRRISGRRATPCGSLLREADRRVRDGAASARLDRPGDPLLHRAEAAFTILEHEAMHQETLLYMWHRLPLRSEAPSAGLSARGRRPPPAHEWIEIPAGRATLGADRRRASVWMGQRVPGVATSASISARRGQRAFHDSAAARRHERATYLEFVEPASGPRTALLGAARRRVVLARHVRSDPAAARRGRST